MTAIDPDTLMRMAAFEHVRRLGEVHDHLTATELKPGFLFDGGRFPLINPQRGIFKPQQMRFLLSIKTVFPKPGGKVCYDDQREVHRQIFEGDETIDYAFMGHNPKAAHNRWLPEACENQIPIIYFLRIAPGRYQAMLPAFINLSQANKLSRTYALLLDALNRHRGKGQQKVTVEHVHVHSGGQAIVGMVEKPTSGKSSRSEKSEH